MFHSLPGWLGVPLVFAPPVLQWWWGRALARQTDDPVLPERLAAHNRRCTRVTAVCATLAALLLSSLAVVTVGSIVVGNMIAGFPLRRILYEETWSLAAFLGFFGRLMLAVFGFWLLLGAIPWVAWRAGRWDWLVGGALAVIPVLWSWRSTAILRRVLRSQPVTNADLLSRFDALVAKSGIPAPRFEYIALNGGVVANAMAVPALDRSSVIFTDTLLARFSEDEIVAICAHELGHLEYYDRRRLRRSQAATTALIAGAALIVPLMRIVAGKPDPAAPLVWGVVLIVMLALRARHRQRNETASDVRAVALTGDPEALVRALTKLHAIARIPRRWDREREERATHPSLARRIRDIRASVDALPVALDAPATFDGFGDGTTATFYATHVDWRDPSGLRSLEYGALSELRLTASSGGAVTLVATESGGRSWRLTPRAEDMTALQAVLDVVDGRILHHRPARSVSNAVVRCAATVFVTVALGASQFAFAFVTMLAVMVPSTPVLTGAGISGLVAALLVVINGAHGPRGFVAGLSAGVALCLLAMAWVQRGTLRRSTDGAMAVLIACGACAVVAIAAAGLEVTRLNQSAKAMPSAVVLTSALAAAAWTRGGSRAWRYAAATASIATLSILVVGTAPFLYAFARDPFLAPGVPVTQTRLQTEPVWAFDVPFPVATVRVSPRGRLVAVASDEDDDAQATRGARLFRVAAAGRRLTTVEADDLVFSSDDRALLLTFRPAGAELREIDVATGAVRWRQPLGDVAWGTLTLRTRTHTWTVDGRSSARRLVHLTGTVGDAAIRQTTAPAESFRGGWIEAWATRGDHVLTIKKQVDFGFMRRGVVRGLLRDADAGIGPHSTITLSLSRGGDPPLTSQSTLDASCLSDTDAAGRVVCAAFDGIRTNIVTVDPESGSIAPTATIPGRFTVEAGSPQEWIAGWSDRRAAAIRLSTREAIVSEGSDDDDSAAVAVTGAAFATASYGTRASTVRVYSIVASK